MNKRKLKNVKRRDLAILKLIKDGAPCTRLHFAGVSDSYDRLHDAGLIVTDGLTEAGWAALHAYEVTRG